MDLYISMSFIRNPIPSSILKHGWDFKKIGIWKCPLRKHTQKHMCVQNSWVCTVKRRQPTRFFFFYKHASLGIQKACFVRSSCSIVYNFYQCGYFPTTYLKAHFSLVLNFFESPHQKNYVNWANLRHWAEETSLPFCIEQWTLS